MAEAKTDDACIGDDELIAMFERDDGATLRRARRRHLDGCAECRGLFLEMVRQKFPADEAPPVRRESRTAGRYRLGAVLGMGAMGVVYAAEDPVLGRAVAIKVIRSGTADPVAYRARLQREGQHLARVQHPNVVAIYDVGETNGQVFVAMELIEGVTLRDWIAVESRSLREVAALFSAIGQGLLAVHAAGLVHRDFKPENVLIDATDGRPRVSDFGLAWGAAEMEDSSPDAVATAAAARRALEANRADKSERLTRTGALLGTLGYMGPEQLCGERATPATDVFAFATSVWEALFGARPFAGSSPQELLASIESQRIATRPSVVAGRAPAALRQALLRAFRVEVARRPRLEELVALLQSIALPPPRQSWWAIAAASACGAALLGGGVFGAFHWRSAQCEIRPAEQQLIAAKWAGLREAHQFAAALDTARTMVCHAQLAGTVAPTTAAAQNACLDERQRAFFASVAALDAGPATSPRVVAGLASLDAPALCATPLTTYDDGAPVTRGDLTDADVALRFGRVEEATALASRVVSSTSLRTHPSLHAAGLRLLGRAQRGEPAAALRRFGEAVSAALYASDFTTAALAAQEALETVEAVDRAHSAPAYVASLPFFESALDRAIHEGHLGAALGSGPFVARARLRRAEGNLLAAEIELRTALLIETDGVRRRAVREQLADLLRARRDEVGAATVRTTEGPP